jgi:integrase/recombinase XerD
MRRDVAGLVDDYLAGRLARGEISPRTRRLLQSRLDSLARVCPDSAALDRAALLRWAGTLALRPSSRRAYQSTVRVFVSWCAAEGHLDGDPGAGLRKIREPRREPRALSVKAVRALFAACPDARARAIVALMVGCGLRCCEVANLEMADWDTDAGTLHVRGKGGHERRLPVPDEVDEALRAYRRRRGAVAGALIASQHPGRDGMAGWMAAAGIHQEPRDGRSGHALRHTCASDVYEGSHDLRTVQEMLGHQNLNTTALYLRHSNLDRMRVAMAGRRYAATA